MQFQEIKRIVIPSLCALVVINPYPPKIASSSTNESIFHLAMSLPFALLS